MRGSFAAWFFRSAATALSPRRFAANAGLDDAELSASPRLHRCEPFGAEAEAFEAVELMRRSFLLVFATEVRRKGLSGRCFFHGDGPVFSTGTLRPFEEEDAAPLRPFEEEDAAPLRWNEEEEEEAAPPFEEEDAAPPGPRAGMIPEVGLPCSILWKESSPRLDGGASVWSGLVQFVVADCSSDSSSAEEEASSKSRFLVDSRPPHGCFGLRGPARLRGPPPSSRIFLASSFSIAVCRFRVGRPS